MNFLINRTDAIGDNILTMPMAQAIKDLFPEARVAFITSQIASELYLDHPFIDEIFILNKKDSYLAKLKQCLTIFKKFKPTHYYYVGGSQTPNFIAWLKRVSLRGGILSRWTTFFVLNKGTRQKRSKVAQHEIFYNVDLLRHLKGFEKVDDKEYIPQIFIDKSEDSFIAFKEEVSQAGINIADKKICFIHPGMTGHTLNWPMESYASLVRRLNLIYNKSILFVISHTPSDVAYLDEFKEHIGQDDNLKESLYFFDGSKKGLRNYINTLQYANLFIGPSTGTVHIAATLSVPTIGIYSPIKAQSSLRWGPVGNGEIKTIAPTVVCGETVECAKDTCPYFECMSKIEVNDVIRKVRELLEK